VCRVLFIYARATSDDDGDDESGFDLKNKSLLSSSFSSFFLGFLSARETPQLTNCYELLLLLGELLRPYPIIHTHIHA
jgi:hypothetical protein